MVGPAELSVSTLYVTRGYRGKKVSGEQSPEAALMGPVCVGGGGG